MISTEQLQWKVQQSIISITAIRHIVFVKKKAQRLQIIK